MSSVYYQGTVRRILITDDGIESIRKMCEVHRAQITKELARANALARRLADTGQLRSPDQWRNEGDGFWAIRAGTVRFYGWYEPDGLFVISHVISKRHEKLADADKHRMNRNRNTYRNDIQRQSRGNTS